MSFPAYDDYKNSGIDWLGKVPKHWNVVSIKRRFEIVGGSTPKSGEESLWEGDIRWATPSDLSKLDSLYLRDTQRTITDAGLQSCGTTLVPAGSIILSTRAPIGSLAIAEAEMCTNQGCKSLIPCEHADSKYFAYLLSISSDELNIRGKGTTFLELSADALGAFKVPAPSLDEQKSISSFLDTEASKIDGLVSEQSRLIELLKEKRQAVISHAVTKGLNPNGPTKPSGIQWLGDVPAHWRVKKFKHLLQMIVDNRGRTPPFGDDGVPMLEAKQITEGTRHPSHSFTKFVPREIVDQFERDKVREGDVLMTTVGATAGRAVLVDAEPDYFIAQNVIGMRPQTDVLSDFLFYLVISDFFYCSLFMTNKSNTIDNLKVSVFINNYCALPPLEEQEPIVLHLNEQLKTFSQLQAEAERAIELLQERRTALISAAVTGKIDVRNIAAKEAA